jgi:type I restriction enzyme, S subunit
MTENIQKYEKYKTSGVEWLGDVPQHWEVKRLKFSAQLSSMKVLSKESSLNYIGMENIESSTGKYITTKSETEGLANYFNKGDILFGKLRPYLAKVYLAKNEGICSTEFLVYKAENDIHNSYLHFLMLSPEFINLIDSSTYGSKMPRANSEFIGNQLITIPPLAEQTAIAAYLDEKTTQLDTAIAQKQHMIALLKERRQILIHRAVTQGLDPSVKMKKSGVEWIGDVPEHWEVKRAKFLFDEIDERSKTGEEELLSVSHMTGVTPRSEKNVSMFMAEDYTGSKLCQKGDLIFNIMWAWMGALGISDRTGIVSPSYAIYRQKEGSFNSWYLEQLLGDTNYVAHYNRVSTGLHSSRLRFYSTMFFDMKIGFPSLEEQNRIVDFLKINVEKIDTALTLKEQEIVKLKEYKSTLINSAVTGKIRVKSEK